MFHFTKKKLMQGAARVPLDLERKDFNPETFAQEFKTQFETFTKAAKDAQAKNDAAIVELQKKGAIDVVTKDELAKYSKQLDEIKESINAELAKLKRPNLNADGTKAETPEQAEYKAAFNEYFRTGKGDKDKGTADHVKMKELEKKAMSVDSDPDGGFTVTPQIESQIDQTLKQVSPLRQFASVVQIGTDSYKMLVNVHGTASGWVGEREARPQTNASTFVGVDIPVSEMYAMPAATQKLLDDSNVNIEQWIADEVQLEFAQKEGAAFISGDGVNKPRGFLSYPIVANASWAWGSVGYIATGSASGYDGTVKADALINLYYALKSPYRANARFLMNNGTIGQTRLLKDGQGNYLVNSVLTVQGGSVIETILGKPVVETPDLADFASNSYSAAFGDWARAYQIVDRVGIRVLRDPYTAKPYVLFYTTKRVGGAVKNFEAFKLLKTAVS